MFYEFPEKLKTIIQHPFKPFLLKNLPNVVEEIILPLTETKIIELLNNFLDEWGIIYSYLILKKIF